MLKSHKGEYRVRGKEGPSFWIPAYAISTVLYFHSFAPSVAYTSLYISTSFYKKSQEEEEEEEEEEQQQQQQEQEQQLLIYQTAMLAVKNKCAHVLLYLLGVPPYKLVL